MHINTNEYLQLSFSLFALNLPAELKKRLSEGDET